MQQQEVLELIETVVRPLRQKIEYLEKQNEELKTQISTLRTQRSETRLRSSSREEHRIPKKEEPKDTRSPSLKKKEEKPAWNYGKVNRPEKGIYRSPPPVEKKATKPGTGRPESKEKNTRTSNEKSRPQKKESVQYISFERQGEPKKIMGGQKFSEPGSVKGDPELKENSLINGKHNPESHPSQDVSSTGGSHLVQGGGEEES